MPVSDKPKCSGCGAKDAPLNEDGLCPGCEAQKHEH